MPSLLEWNERTHYALTELILFLISSLVVALGICISCIVSYFHMKSGVSFFSTLLPLFENVLPSAIAFTPAKSISEDQSTQQDRSNDGTDGSTEQDRSNDNTDGSTKPDIKVDLVFLGHQERAAADGGTSSSMRRIWVHVYFILLCCIIIVWAISVFSHTLLYRKITSCTDISLADTDLSCFLLSKRNIPEGVQEIIDEEEGQLIPCDRVQNYIILQNISFDLEVICYQYQLNPLAALGISYGAMKSIAFTTVSILSVILTLTKRLYPKVQKCCKIEDNPEEISTHIVVTSHIFQLVISITISVIVAIVAVVIHEAAGTRNSGFDYLRGEMFYRYSVVVLACITIIYTVGLFPWWAFGKLTEPTDWDFKGSEDEVKKKMYGMVHNIVLHEKFASGFTAVLDILTANALGDGDKGQKQQQGTPDPEQQRDTPV